MIMHTNGKKKILLVTSILIKISVTARLVKFQRVKLRDVSTAFNWLGVTNCVYLSEGMIENPSF